jgi:hypothetical protein
VRGHTSGFLPLCSLQIGGVTQRVLEETAHAPWDKWQCTVQRLDLASQFLRLSEVTSPFQSVMLIWFAIFSSGENQSQINFNWQVEGGIFTITFFGLVYFCSLVVSFYLSHHSTPEPTRRTLRNT